MRRVLAYLLLLLLLFTVACGGGSDPAVSAGADNSGAADNTSNTAETGAEQASTDSEGAEEVNAEEPAPEEPATEEESDTASEAESDAAATGGDAAYSGIDPATGLEINPVGVVPGMTFIARGEVIQMNLTPQTEPEFVIRAPSGESYRVRTQPLSDVFLEDGSQLRPFEYKIGMEAMTTATLPADAGPTDVLLSDDFVIISLP